MKEGNNITFESIEDLNDVVNGRKNASKMSDISKIRTLCHDFLRIVEPVGKSKLSEYDKSNIRYELIKSKKSFTEALNNAIQELNIR